MMIGYDFDSKNVLDTLPLDFSNSEWMLDI